MIQYIYSSLSLISRWLHGGEPHSRTFCIYFPWFGFKWYERERLEFPFGHRWGMRETIVLGHRLYGKTGGAIFMKESKLPYPIVRCANSLIFLCFSISSHFLAWQHNHHIWLIKGLSTIFPCCFFCIPTK